MKKLFKKSLAVILAVVLTLSAAPLSGFVGLELPSLFDFKAEGAETYSGTCGKNLTWELDTETGVLNITGLGKMKNYGPSTVPWGSYRSYIKSAIISDGVTSIGSYVFAYCYSLITVTIGNSVAEINRNAFTDCDSLTYISIPDSVEKIGECAFEYADNLTYVVLEENLTSIDACAFANCKSLISITIPNSVIKIGNSVFSFCEKLNSVIIGKNVSIIEERSFFWCRNLENVEFSENSKLTTIGNNAFENCDNLKSITIPSSVTTIGNSAFEDCSSLINVTIPEKVTIIGDNAFDGCRDIKYALIGNNVKEIGEYAFRYCRNLENIIIPNSVITIGDGVVYGCIKLEYIHMPLGIIDIQGNIFSDTMKNTYICSDSSDCYAKEYAEANGYTFKVCNGEHSNADTPIEPENPTELTLVSTYPANGAKKISCTDDLVLTFNQPVEDHLSFVEDHMRIAVCNYNTDEVVFEINGMNSVSYFFLIDYNQNTITIHDVFKKISPNEKYYILISPGLIYARDDHSIEFEGITNKDDLTFIYNSEAEKKGYSIELYSSKASLSLSKDETVTAMAILMLNGEICEQHGMSFTVKDTSVAEVTPISSDSTGTTFKIKAKKYGITSIDIICADRSLKESYIIRVSDQKTVYYLDDIKGRSQGNNPFYTCGVYVDDLSYTTRTDKSAVVQFDVYNYEHSYGAVEVHDAMGNLVDCEMISMFDGEYQTDLVEHGIYAYKVLHDTVTGDLFDDGIYKTDVKSEKTSISVIVPHGGYIVITKNVAESMPCLLYNTTLLALEGAKSLSKLMFDDDGLEVQTESKIIEEVVKATLDEIGWTDIAIKAAETAITNVVNTIMKAANEINISKMVGATQDLFEELEEFYSTLGIDYQKLLTSVIKSCAPDFVGFVTGFSMTALGEDIVDTIYYKPVKIAKYCAMLSNIVSNSEEEQTYIYNTQSGNERFSNKVTVKSDSLTNDTVFHSILLKSGKTQDALNYCTGTYEEAFLYDISLVKNGNKVQPSSAVKVFIPLPEGWSEDTITVYHETGFMEYEQLEVEIENGFVVFETTGFSYFFLADGEIVFPSFNVGIVQPSKTKINFGDTLVLSLGEIEIPEGYAIAWFVEGAGVSTWVSEDGLECRVTSIANGNPTIYAKLVDEEENVITNADGEEIFDEITLFSKAGFWQKFISFFKNLFGINRVIY